MKSMNRKEGKKIAVMAAVIMGLMVIAFMPAASAAVTYFGVDPDTGYAGTTDSYNILVDTTGVQTLNITIPPGFLAVAPTAPGQELLTVNFWNTTGALDFYGIGIMTANGTNTVDVSVRFRIGGVELTGTTTQNVDYTPGATYTFESPLKGSGDTSTVKVKLPTEAEGGYMDIDITCLDFYLESMGVNLKQCVRNPTVAGEYTFTANGEDAKVDIKATGDYGGSVYRNGKWFIRTEDSPLAKVYCYWWGIPTDKPVTGDWDGDGTDTIGVYRNGAWILSNSITTPSVDHFFWWGIPTDKPVTGDWDGDGKDTIGVYRNGAWILSNSITTPSVDHMFWWGIPSDKPLTEDWNDDGKDTIGVYRNGAWILSNSITTPSADQYFAWGWPNDVPFAGHWI